MVTIIVHRVVKGAREIKAARYSIYDMRYLVHIYILYRENQETMLLVYVLTIELSSFVIDCINRSGLKHSTYPETIISKIL